MQKQVYNLLPDDIRRTPVWYFPMDQSVLDEMTVRELPEHVSLPDGIPVIVRCSFIDTCGGHYEGYVYYDEDATAIEYLKPVLWRQDLCVTFWNGMDELSPNYIKAVVGAIPEHRWPIAFSSEAVSSYPSVRGILHGLYHLSDDLTRVECVKIGTSSGV